MREKCRRVGIAVLAVFLLASRAKAGPILHEGFDDIGTLAGDGWVQTNNSSPIGTTGWFQGNPGIFEAYSGADTSYIAANYLNADAGGAISNWLISPVVELSSSSVLSFWTRSTDLAGEDYHDSLEVRVSKKDSTDVGSSFDSVGDFSTLLLTINPAFAAGTYKNEWTLYTLSLADFGFGGAIDGRFAFRYIIDDTTAHGDYIGIDSAALETVVPEPGGLLVTAIGLMTLAVLARRRGLA